MPSEEAVTAVAEHPDIREEADLMVQSAIAEEASKTMLKMHGPPPGDSDGHSTDEA